MDPRDVIRARLTDLFEVGGLDFHFWMKEDYPRLLILNNRALGFSIRYLFAGRLEAVTALIRKEVPGHLLSGDFTEPNQFPRVIGEVRGILMVPPVDRFFNSPLIPLFAGDLTAPAGRALRCVNEDRFSFCHETSPPFILF
jgi:hypothetical protein